MKSLTGFLSKLQIAADRLSLSITSLQNLLITLWFKVVQWLCVAFIVIHSQFLSASFTVFCVAVMCLMHLTLCNMKLYREAGKQKKKIIKWVAIGFIVVSVAQIWGFIVSTEEAYEAVSKFRFAAIEAVFILVMIEWIKKVIAKFQSRKKDKRGRKTESGKQIKSKI